MPRNANNRVKTADRTTLLAGILTGRSLAAGGPNVSRSEASSAAVDYLIAALGGPPNPEAFNPLPPLPAPPAPAARPGSGEPLAP